MVRDVDALDPLPDEKIKAQDAEYLERHQINVKFEAILERLLRNKPKDHLQFIIDCLTFDNLDEANQDTTTGMSMYRLSKLKKVFEYIDKDADGKVQYQDIQLFTSRFGGQVLGEDELRDIFRDFDRSEDEFVTQDEFFNFFAKISFKMKNKEFDNMIDEMMS